MVITFRSRIHAIFILIVGGAVIAAATLLFLHYEQRGRAVGAPQTPYNEVLAGPHIIIPVSIADTDTEREQGLSGTVSLPADSGKLFVFDVPGNYGFWMKDMNYALDFVWISSDLKIVGITPDVAVATYPQIFYPVSPSGTGKPQVKYVLEVNSGFSTRHGLTVGEQLYLQE